MVVLKIYKFLLWIGPLSLLLGGFGIFSELFLAGSGDNSILPTGAQSHSDYVIYPVSGQTLSVDYTVGSGSVVDIYLLAPSEFEKYKATQPFDYLYYTHGDRGSFTYDFEVDGTFYMVVDHASGYYSEAPRVDIHYALLGLNARNLLVFSGFLVAGIVFTLIGMRQKARDPKAIIEQMLVKIAEDEKPKDVMYFDDKKQNR